jgi:hypothetical protein
LLGSSQQLEALSISLLLVLRAPTEWWLCVRCFVDGFSLSLTHSRACPSRFLLPGRALSLVPLLLVLLSPKKIFLSLSCLAAPSIFLSHASVSQYFLPVGVPVGRLVSVGFLIRRLFSGLVGGNRTVFHLKPWRTAHLKTIDDGYIGHNKRVVWYMLPPPFHF